MKRQGRSRRRVSVPDSVQPVLRRIGQVASRSGASAYAVGGCVRDWLLGIRDTADLDVTIEGKGLEIARDIAGTLGGTITVHEQFRTATVVVPRAHPASAPGTSIRIDVATCRRETYARPGAYPQVSAGALQDDLFRRDFTINAMGVALAPARFGGLVDSFGGAADVRRRILRMLHAQSFVDDPSRILRGVRFLARFGLRWDRRTEQAARRALAAGALGWLNAGRLRKELDRMLAEPDPWECLHQLAALLGSIGRRSRGRPAPGVGRGHARSSSR